MAVLEEAQSYIQLLKKTQVVKLVIEKHEHLQHKKNPFTFLEMKLLFFITIYYFC